MANRLLLGSNTCKATVKLVAMLGLVPSAHEMETMEILFHACRKGLGMRLATPMNHQSYHLPSYSQ